MRSRHCGNVGILIVGTVKNLPRPYHRLFTTIRLYLKIEIDNLSGAEKSLYPTSDDSEEVAEGGFRVETNAGLVGGSVGMELDNHGFPRN